MPNSPDRPLPVASVVLDVCAPCRAGEQGPYTVGCAICEAGGPVEGALSPTWARSELSRRSASELAAAYERFAVVWAAVAHHARTLDDRALGHPDYVLLDRDDIDNHLYNAVRDFDPEMWDERVPGLGTIADKGRSCEFCTDGEHPSLGVDCPTCGSPVGCYCNTEPGTPSDTPHYARKYAAGTHRKCSLCDDDGYVEDWNAEGDEIIATRDCPRLSDPDHAPFNATGILT